MNQQRLLFEYHPGFLLACLGIGISYAWLLYRSKHTWSTNFNRALFLIRCTLVFFLAVLILGPVLKLIHNIIEKPSVVFLVDNSSSIKEVVDSARITQLQNNLRDVIEKLKDAGYESDVNDLEGKVQSPLIFNNNTSDLAGALKAATAAYEGKNLAGIVLISDGIYNSGSSPLYNQGRIPIFTVGVGDSTSRTDVILKNLAFNKIAYQGNKFPMRVEVLAEGDIREEINVSLYHDGKVIGAISRTPAGKGLLDFDFQIDAYEKGIQRIDVVVTSPVVEKNRKNNRATAFVEVVEGKKKILMIAPAPHPDIKALRAVVEKNSNYEFILHIPGVHDAQAPLLVPGVADLVIFHQAVDLQGRTAGLTNLFLKSNTASFLMLGTGSNLRGLQASQIPLVFDKTGQWDEVTPVVNSAFRDFGFADNSNLIFSKYPPASVPFGKFTYPANASVLLFQQIGSVATNRPMLFTYDDNGKKTGVLIADGIWRWRLNEYSETEKTEAFDEVFSKLIQYLSTHDDKRKFRSFPLQNEFSDAEPVEFESQVYNDLFQQVYGNKIDLRLKDESGKVTAYNYVTSQANSRYRIGGLKEGVYKYVASTPMAGKNEEVQGEFLVKARNIESQNLTADFGLLQKLSAQTGGKFFSAKNIMSLSETIPTLQAKGLIHTEETFDQLINAGWVFFVLLVLISTEWFLRKYLGAY